MPHKNPDCKKCHRKMKHHKWIEYASRGAYGSFIWKREVKCPKCGNTAFDWMSRVGKGANPYE